MIYIADLFCALFWASQRNKVRPWEWGRGLGTGIVGVCFNPSIWKGKGQNWRPGTQRNPVFKGKKNHTHTHNKRKESLFLSLGYILYRFLYLWANYFEYDSVLKTKFSVIVLFMDFGIKNIHNYWEFGVCFH